jgi:hypothetical protein
MYLVFCMYFNNHLLIFKGKGINLEEVLHGIGLVKSIPIYQAFCSYQIIELITANETRYYFSNYVFDHNWNLISQNQTNNLIEKLCLNLRPLGYYSLKLIDNDVYIGYKNQSRVLLKLGKQWNIVKQQNINSYCYDSTNYLLYTKTDNIQGIQIFNLNLSLVDFISLSDYYQYEIINVHKNQLFLSRSYDKKIIVIQNKKIINQFYACSQSTKVSILFDEFDNMLFWCPVTDCGSVFYVYSINGTYKNFVRINPNYMNFDSMTIDSKSRIIVTGYSFINIYATSSDFLVYNGYDDLSVIYDCDFVWTRQPETTTTMTTTTMTETSTVL